MICIELSHGVVCVLETKLGKLLIAKTQYDVDLLIIHQRLVFQNIKHCVDPPQIDCLVVELFLGMF